MREVLTAPAGVPVLSAIGVVLVAGAVGGAALGAAGGVATVHVALILWIGLSYGFSGLVAWRRQPANRFGPLMTATGCVTLATTLSWTAALVPQTIGQALDLLPLVMIVHVFLAYPGGRVRGRWDRLVVATGYVAAIGGQLVVMVLGPPQLLAVVAAPVAAQVLHNVTLVAISVTALAAVALLAARRVATGRPLRRSLSLLIDSFALGLLMIAVLLVFGVFAQLVFPTVQRISLALIGLAPLAFLAGLLSARLARTAVGALVLELRAEPTDLRAPLARALRDPSLSLIYWLPQFGSWADQEGKPVEPVEAVETGGRATTMIEHDGRRVAALVHDPALRDEPELLDAVAAAAALALRTGRLRAELRANLDELRESRARVIEAGQKERQRLERDLHDGAQQRLVALSLDLGLLQTRLAGDEKDLLDRAREEVSRSLSELRDVAHGLHPAVLTAHGLAVALESLVARAPVPVRLTVRMAERVAEPVEVAAYYVVSESLTNIGKHAAATSATVDVTHADGQVVVEVVDDGVGGADTERGSGLRGLADRVEALGGRLRVWTPPGVGTRVRAELPCG